MTESYGEGAKYRVLATKIELEQKKFMALVESEREELMNTIEGLEEEVLSRGTDELYLLEFIKDLACKWYHGTGKESYLTSTEPCCRARRLLEELKNAPK